MSDDINNESLCRVVPCLQRRCLQRVVASRGHRWNSGRNRHQDTGRSRRQPSTNYTRRSSSEVGQVQAGGVEKHQRRKRKRKRPSRRGKEPREPYAEIQAQEIRGSHLRHASSGTSSWVSRVPRLDQDATKTKEMRLPPPLRNGREAFSSYSLHRDYEASSNSRMHPPRR